MIRQVARREIVTRGRSKAFRITTLVLVLLAVAGVIGAGFFASDDDDDTIDFDVAAPAELEDALAAATSEGVEIDISQLSDDEAEAAVSEGDIDAAVLQSGTVLYDEEPDPLLDSIVAGALQGVEIQTRAAESGIDASELGALLAPVDVERRIIDPASDSDSAKTAVALLGIFVTFFAIQTYGSQIAMVVAEEKSNRITEILLALVSPRDLLVGKLIGVGALAAVHVVIVVAGLFAALAVSGFTDAPTSAYASLPLLFVMFVLGFTMYGTLFALVGSLVSRQEDTQQALIPVFVPIFIGYFLAIQAVTTPDSTLATITSMVPFTSPFALPVTVAQGAASPLVIIVAIVLLIAMAAAIMALAARIYEFTLLRTGTRIPLTEALQLARRRPDSNEQRST